MMVPYRNLSDNSNVVSYKSTEDSIYRVFRSGRYRNYLYKIIHPGHTVKETMKWLAARGYGLNSYISSTVKGCYTRK